MSDEDDTTYTFPFIEIIGFWLLAMTTSEVWYGGTEAITELSTWASWIFWGQMILTILLVIGVVLLIAVLLLILLVGIEKLLRRNDDLTRYLRKYDS